MSLTSRRPVADQIGFRLENTLLLAAVAAMIAVPLAICLGLVAAIRQGTVFDRGISVSTLLAISVPEFFIGYILIFFVAVHLGWLPAGGAG